MLSITIPLWILWAAAGVPALCVLWLGLRLVRARRKRRALEAGRAMMTPDTGHGGFAERIHFQILEQQIDAVFDALETVIGTERVKLKALVRHALPPDRVPAPLHRERRRAKDPSPSGMQPDETDLPVGEQVALLAGDGMAPEEIAYRLGLAGAEVALALKMRAGSDDPRGRTLEAVA